VRDELKASEAGGAGCVGRCVIAKTSRLSMRNPPEETQAAMVVRIRSELVFGRLWKESGTPGSSSILHRLADVEGRPICCEMWLGGRQQRKSPLP